MAIVNGSATLKLATLVAHVDGYVRDPSARWFVTADIFLDTGTMYESSAALHHPSRIYSGRVLNWGSIDLSVGVPSGMPQVAGGQIRVADPDNRLRDQLISQTPRRRIVQLKMLQENSSEASWPPTYRGEIVDFEKGPGYLQLSFGDRMFAWLDYEIDGLINRTNFPELDPGVDEAFLPIITGINLSTGLSAQGVIQFPHIGFTPEHGDRWGMAQHPCWDLTTLYRQLPDEGIYTVVDPAEFAITIEDRTIESVNFRLSFIDFPVEQPKGTQLRGDVHGISGRGGWNGYPPAGADFGGPPGALRNPIDFFINMTFLVLKRAGLPSEFQAGQIMALWAKYQTVGLCCDGAITSKMTAREFLGRFLSSHGLYMYQNRNGKITLAEIDQEVLTRPLYTDKKHIEKNTWRERRASPTVNTFRYQYGNVYATGEWSYKKLLLNEADKLALGKDEEDTISLWFVRDTYTADWVIGKRARYQALGSYRQEFSLPAPQVIDQLELLRHIGVTHPDGLAIGGYTDQEVVVTNLTIDLDTFRARVKSILRVPKLIDQTVFTLEPETLCTFHREIDIDPSTEEGWLAFTEDTFIRSHQMESIVLFGPEFHVLDEGVQTSFPSGIDGLRVDMSIDGARHQSTGLQQQPLTDAAQIAQMRYSHSNVGAVASADQKQFWSYWLGRIQCDQGEPNFGAAGQFEAAPQDEGYGDGTGRSPTHGWHGWAPSFQAPANVDGFTTVAVFNDPLNTEDLVDQFMEARIISTGGNYETFGLVLRQVGSDATAAMTDCSFYIMVLANNLAGAPMFAEITAYKDGVPAGAALVSDIAFPALKPRDIVRFEAIQEGADCRLRLLINGVEKLSVLHLASDPLFRPAGRFGISQAEFGADYDPKAPLLIDAVKGGPADGSFFLQDNFEAEDIDTLGSGWLYRGFPDEVYAIRTAVPLQLPTNALGSGPQIHSAFAAVYEEHVDGNRVSLRTEFSILATAVASLTGDAFDNGDLLTIGSFVEEGGTTLTLRVWVSDTSQLGHLSGDGSVITEEPLIEVTGVPRVVGKLGIWIGSGAIATSPGGDCVAFSRSDSFTRSDELLTDGAAWRALVPEDPTPFRIVSNKLRVTTLSITEATYHQDYVVHAEHVNPPYSFTGLQYAEMTYAGTHLEAGDILRSGPAIYGTEYELLYVETDTTHQLIIMKWDAPAVTAVDQLLEAGDIISIASEFTSSSTMDLVAKLNGSEIARLAGEPRVVVPDETTGEVGMTGFHYRAGTPESYQEWTGWHGSADCPEGEMACDPTHGTVLFSDDFARADAGNLGGAYTELGVIGAAFRVIGGDLVEGVTSDDSSSYTNGTQATALVTALTGIANAYIKVVCGYIGSWGNIGVCFRTSSQEDVIAIDLNQSQWSMYRTTAGFGIFDTIGSGTTQPTWAENDVLEFQCYNNAAGNMVLRILKNDVEFAKVTVDSGHADYVASGGIGLWSDGSGTIAADQARHIKSIEIGSLLI